MPLPMQMCGPTRAGLSLEQRWLSQMRSHHLLQNDTRSSYLYQKDLPGRGEQGVEGACRRGRQLPSPTAFCLPPASSTPLRELVKPNLWPSKEPSPSWCRMGPSHECPLGKPALGAMQGDVSIPGWDIPSSACPQAEPKALSLPMCSMEHLLIGRHRHASSSLPGTCCISCFPSPAIKPSQGRDAATAQRLLCRHPLNQGGAGVPVPCPVSQGPE